MTNFSIVSRVWLLIAVLQEVGGRGSWITPTSGRQPLVYDGSAGDELQLPPPSGSNTARRRVDVVPPKMLKLFAEQEAQHSRVRNSVVRSFYDQGWLNESTPVTSTRRSNKFLIQQVTCHHFNLTEIPATEITQRAELSLYFEQHDRNRTSTTMVIVYRAKRPLVGSECAVDDAAVQSGHLRVVARRTFPASTGSSWTSLVVSRAVTRWRRRPEKNFGFVVVWTRVSASSPAVGRHRAYLVTYGVDESISPTSFREFVGTRPHPPTTTSPTASTDTESADDSRQRRHSKRSRRSRPRSRGSRKHRRRRRSLCRRRPMYVDFGEIGWDDWIVAPPGYEAFYCAGDCPFYLPDHLNTTNHAIVQALIHSVDARLAPKPCCVPTVLSPMSLLYVDNDDNVVLKNYEDMIVEACGCR